MGWTIGLWFGAACLAPFPTLPSAHQHAPTPGPFPLIPPSTKHQTTTTGQLISNLQSAGTDAWKVFQEAMEAEGTMQAMGAGVAEITNLRQNFFQKFLDVRAER